MENTKNLSNEPGRPSSKGTAPGSHGSASHTTVSDVANTAASAAQRAKEGVQSAYEETKQVVNDAYGKTTEVLTNTYDQAMVYGKDNPGKLTLIAFGAGIGIGVLLASSLSGGRSRSSRIGEPLVTALSEVALAFLR